jgi:hypothetical protein
VSEAGRRLGVESANALEIAVVRSLTHASIDSSFRSGLDGSLVSRYNWNLDQSVFVRSGRSGRLRKEDRHPVSISIGK